jgi:hypothetical protein
MSFNEVLLFQSDNFFKQSQHVLSLGFLHMGLFHIEVFKVFFCELFQQNLLVGCLREKVQVLNMLVCYLCDLGY